MTAGMQGATIGIVDAENWHAVVLVVQQPGGEKPLIRCVGFKDKRARDSWLVWFNVSMMALWDAIPARVGRSY